MRSRGLWHAPPVRGISREGTPWAPLLCPSLLPNLCMLGHMDPCPRTGTAGPRGAVNDTVALVCTSVWAKPGPAELPQSWQAGDLTANPHRLGWGGQDGGAALPPFRRICFISNYKEQACFVRIISGC